MAHSVRMPLDMALRPIGMSRTGFADVLGHEPYRLRTSGGLYSTSFQSGPGLPPKHSLTTMSST